MAQMLLNLCGMILLDGVWALQAEESLSFGAEIYQRFVISHN